MTSVEHFPSFKFDARWYCDDTIVSIQANEDPENCRNRMKQLVASVDPEDPLRLKYLDLKLFSKLLAWLGKYQSLRKDPHRYQAVKYERSHKVFASDVAMVELSDCIGYHLPCNTPQEILEAVEDRKGWQPIVYLNIVKIGVSDCYQRLGIATAVLDCLTHVCKNYGYAYIQIECVLSERLRSLLAKRKDCSSLQNGGTGCSFLIKFE